MTNKSSAKGFTLIELLVVVAIIGILAATILASLGSARAKARDARIVSELNSIRSQMELFYLSNGGYDTTGTAQGTLHTCASGAFATGPDNAGQLLRSIATSVNGSPTNFGDMDCNANAESWAVQALLRSTNKYWCVDSSGRSVDIGLGLIWGNNNTYTCLP